MTHTFLGAALADAGLKRRTPLAAATLVIGANLPDVDVLAYFHGGDAALGFRRGWTHGVLAWVVLPLLLTAAILAFDRLRSSWRGTGPRAAAGQIAFLAFLGIATHPLLDWLNTYGVRLLMPFDGRWFYGDTLFIVDPWLWLLLGGVIFVGQSRTVRGLAFWGTLGTLMTLALFSTLAALPGSGYYLWARILWVGGLAGWIAARWHRGRAGQDPSSAHSHERSHERLVRRTLAVAALYTLAMLGTTLWVEGRLAQELPAAGLANAERFMVGPAAIDPLAREIVVQTPSDLRLGSFHWLASPRLEIHDRQIPRRPPTAALPPAALERALAAPCVRGMVGWMRFPFFEAEPAADGGHRVFLIDARYARERGEGFARAAVEVPPESGPPRCRP